MKHRILVLALSSLAAADVLDIPWTQGKLAQSVTITVNNGEAISPDSIRVGGAFVIRTFISPSGLAACNTPGTLGLQILTSRTTYRRGTVDTNWMSFSQFPNFSSMALLDSVNGGTGVGGGSGYPTAPGYVVARPGDLDCMTQTYSFAEAWNQVVFIRGNGSAFAKAKIVGYTHTLPGPPPPQYQPKILNTVTLRFVVNSDSSDLVDPNPPVALRPGLGPVSNASKGPFKALYNPLGIRLEREPAPFSPALPRR